MTGEHVGKLPVSWELFKAIMFVVLAVVLYELGRYLVRRAASSVASYFRLGSSNVVPSMAPPAFPPADDADGDDEDGDEDAGKANPLTGVAVVHVTGGGKCFHLDRNCRAIKSTSSTVSTRRPCLVCARKVTDKSKSE